MGGVPDQRISRSSMMLPSVSLNHAAMRSPQSATPSIVFSSGVSYSSKTTPASSDRRPQRVGRRLRTPSACVLPEPGSEWRTRRNVSRPRAHTPTPTDCPATAIGRASPRRTPLPLEIGSRERRIDRCLREHSVLLVVCLPASLPPRAADPEDEDCSRWITRGRRYTSCGRSRGPLSIPRPGKSRP
jgi:hypothetical protein